MGYLSKTLADTGEVGYRAKFNWTYDAIGWAWVAFSAAPMVCLAYGVLRGEIHVEGFDDNLLIVSAAALLTGAAYCLGRYIRKWTTVIAITSTRLILKTGVIGRDSRDINVRKIEEIEIHQSFLGRIFGYGTLIIRGEGMDAIELPPIARPRVFHQKLEEARVTAQSRTADAGASLIADLLDVRAAS